MLKWELIKGEQGKVDESMREMAAIEALKSEKSEKEVRVCSDRSLAVATGRLLISDPNL